MKITIEINAHGYILNYHVNDKVFKYEMRGDSRFIQSTEDSVNWEEESEIPDELGLSVQEISGLSEVIEVIANETTEFHRPPITNDGVTLNKGDNYYEVACTSENGEYKSVVLKSNFPMDWDSSGSSVFSTRILCQKACDNSNRANIKSKN